MPAKNSERTNEPHNYHVVKLVCMLPRYTFSKNIFCKKPKKYKYNIIDNNWKTF